MLEVLADTGSFGLLGLIAAIAFLMRQRQRTTPAERWEAFPYALALFLILFPLNSHFAIYGTYTSSLIWYLMGLWGASLHHDFGRRRRLSDVAGRQRSAGGMP